MRRGPGRSYSSRNDEGEQNFWPSFADMMSSFALILFFIMLLAYLSNIKTSNSLKVNEAKLSAALSSLGIAETELSEKEAELIGAEEALADKQTELDAKQSELDEKELILVNVQVALDAANAELANKQLYLSQQEAIISTQQQYVTEAQQEIERMHGQMETIVGVRAEILQQITDSINAVSGEGGGASIGENGSIVLNNSVFFDTNSSDLRPEAKQVLNRLVSGFCEFLDNPENAQYIDSITISGHTDSTGTDEINRQLSTERANSVLKYLLEYTDLYKYSDYFCAAGYGASRPIADNSTSEGRAQNRRIEISITLKDDTVMDIVNDYLAIEVPGLSVSAEVAGDN